MKKTVQIKYPCENCSEPNSRISKAHHIRLCKKCLELDDYKMICKTNAKRDYFLSDTDLSDYDPVSVYRGGGYSDYVLYNQKDIINHFCTKYEVDHDDSDAISAKQEELAEKRDESRMKRALNVELKQKRRKKELKNALEISGLELRADSKLCLGYIDGSIKDWSIEEIVNRMCQMKYLYDYCHMDKCYKKAEKNQAKEFNAGYIPDVPLFDEAEYIALKKYGKNGGYPKKWPWMRSKKIEKK